MWNWVNFSFSFSFLWKRISISLLVCSNKWGEFQPFWREKTTTKYISSCFFWAGESEKGKLLLTSFFLPLFKNLFPSSFNFFPVKKWFFWPNKVPKCSLINRKRCWEFERMFWRHDTQHDDTQYYDTQHNDTLDNDTQHNDTLDNDTQHGQT